MMKCNLFVSQMYSCSPWRITCCARRSIFALRKGRATAIAPAAAPIAHRGPKNPPRRYRSLLLVCKKRRYIIRKETMTVAFSCFGNLTLGRLEQWDQKVGDLPLQLWQKN